MVSKKLKVNIFLVGMFLLLSIGALSIIGSQGFTLFGEAVWLPKYATASCDIRADHLAQSQIQSHTDAPVIYNCNTQESGKWIPAFPGIQCEYSFPDFATADVRYCSGIVTNLNEIDSKCGKDLATFSGSTRFSVNAGDSLYVNTFKTFGDAKGFVKYPSYGIKFESSTGLNLPQTTNCLMSSVNGQKLHTVNFNQRLEVKPQNPFNVVQGLSQVRGTQVVTITGINNGEPIFIDRPGFYFKVKTADDGFKYVDTASREVQEPRIECIPLTTGCDADAKIIPLIDQPCSKFGGAINGYAPVQGDSQTECVYSCSNGNLQKTSDCRTIPQSCPSDSPLYDSVSGKCISQVERVEAPSEFPTGVLMIFGIFAVLILSMIVLSKKNSNGGGLL